MIKEMQKVILAFCLLLISCDNYDVLILPTGQISLKEYKIKEIKEEEYLFGDNWKQVVKGNAKLYIAYSTAHTDMLKTSGGFYITEMYYFLKKGNTKTLLGYLTTKDGFRDSNGSDLNLAKKLHHDSEYMREHFIGLTLDCINTPFSISILGTNTVTGEYFETDVVALLSIDDKKRTLYPYIYPW